MIRISCPKFEGTADDHTAFYYGDEVVELVVEKRCPYCEHSVERGLLFLERRAEDPAFIEKVYASHFWCKLCKCSVPVSVYDTNGDPFNVVMVAPPWIDVRQCDAILLTQKKWIRWNLSQGARA